MLFRSFEVMALTSPGAQPGQVVMYNGFDTFQFPNWAGPNDAEPGMIKWLHLAGGYGPTCATGLRNGSRAR